MQVVVSERHPVEKGRRPTGKRYDVESKWCLFDEQVTIFFALSPSNLEI